MGKIISFSNQKGGVGKTTTAINLAAYVAKSGRRVLLVDFDPQGNATSGYGIEKNQLETSCYDVLMGDCIATQVIASTLIDNLSILPSNIDLAAAETDLVNMPSRESALKRALEPVKNDYDYIFIDCPPSLGLLTLNALVASDSVIIPIQSEFFALEGLSQLMNTIKIVRQRLNANLSVNGVILTMYDTRTIMSKQVTDEIYKYFGEKIYTVPVPRNIKLVESPSFGVPIAVHAPNSSGAVAYEALAKQFLEREER
ncbi:MAG: AAA family ATPase [Corallococcus sp.]|nr:AAA family ATPase [Corallococcus sp.]MCM1359961.1 AAA family ATPase [Corallococcus sp.]MCM1395517.1 AAA family ATPase [Corallococcus sp.]